MDTDQADYWLAIDGQYLVKYNLALQTSMNPEGDVIHGEISMKLSQVYQPVDIIFHRSCLDASKVTPTP